MTWQDRHMLVTAIKRYKCCRDVVGVRIYIELYMYEQIENGNYKLN